MIHTVYLKGGIFDVKSCILHKTYIYKMYSHVRLQQNV